MHPSDALAAMRELRCEHVPHLVPEERAETHPNDKGDKDACHIVVICTRILLPVALEQLLDLQTPAVSNGSVAVAKPKHVLHINICVQTSRQTSWVQHQPLPHPVTPWNLIQAAHPHLRSPGSNEHVLIAEVLNTLCGFAEGLNLGRSGPAR